MSHPWHPGDCPSCRGAGFRPTPIEGLGDMFCSACDGTGRAKADDDLSQ